MQGVRQSTDGIFVFWVFFFSLIRISFNTNRPFCFVLFSDGKIQVTYYFHSKLRGDELHKGKTTYQEAIKLKGESGFQNHL